MDIMIRTRDPCHESNHSTGIVCNLMLCMANAFREHNELPTAAI